MLQISPLFLPVVEGKPGKEDSKAALKKLRGNDVLVHPDYTWH
jgi:hypothetical protein